MSVTGSTPYFRAIVWSISIEISSVPLSKRKYSSGVRRHTSAISSTEIPSTSRRPRSRSAICWIASLIFRGDYFWRMRWVDFPTGVLAAADDVFGAVFFTTGGGVA